MVEHPSDSTAQREAVEVLARGFAAREGLRVTLRQRIELPPSKAGGVSAQVEVAAVSSDPKVLVQVGARIGDMKTAQVEKVVQDAVKLRTVRDLAPGWEGARLVIVLAAEVARQSIRGWQAIAIRNLGVDVEVVDLQQLDPAMADRVLAAQARQNMAPAPRQA